jgi:KDO2-lipid IV(A) lauroyltransferase
LVRALRRNELVGVLPDQDPGPGSGVFAPLLGVPANTSVLVPRLVQRTGAPVLYVACERLPAGRGFHMRFTPPSPQVRDPDLELATRAMNSDLACLIRRVPEQYLWSYKRFRARPPGSPDPYRAARGDARSGPSSHGSGPGR